MINVWKKFFDFDKPWEDEKMFELGEELEIEPLLKKSREFDPEQSLYNIMKHYERSFGRLLDCKWQLSDKHIRFNNYNGEADEFVKKLRYCMKNSIPNYCILDIEDKNFIHLTFLIRDNGAKKFINISILANTWEIINYFNINAGFFFENINFKKYAYCMHLDSKSFERMGLRLRGHMESDGKGIGIVTLMKDHLTTKNKEKLSVYVRKSPLIRLSTFRNDKTHPLKLVYCAEEGMAMLLYDLHINGQESVVDFIEKLDHNEDFYMMLQEMYVLRVNIFRVKENKDVYDKARVRLKMAMIELNYRFYTLNKKPIFSNKDFFEETKSEMKKVKSELDNIKNGKNKHILFKRKILLENLFTNLYDELYKDKKGTYNFD